MTQEKIPQWPLIVGDFLNDRKGKNRRPTYIKTLKSYLTRFTGAVSTMGCNTLEDVKREHVERWFSQRVENPATRCAGHARISSMFSWGVKADKCQTNIMQKIDRPTVERGEATILTAAQAIKLLAVTRQLKPGMLAYVALGLFAGIRPHELSRMTWKDIDTRPRDTAPGLVGYGMATVSAAAAKVRHRRTVPLHPTLLKWLEFCPRVEHPKRPGMIVPFTRGDAQTNWLARRANIEWIPDILRHTAASQMLAMHQNEYIVARWLGHSPQILFNHYFSLVTPEDCAAFWSISP